MSIEEYEITSHIPYKWVITLSLLVCCVFISIRNTSKALNIFVLWNINKHYLAMLLVYHFAYFQFSIYTFSLVVVSSRVAGMGVPAAD